MLSLALEIVSFLSIVIVFIAFAWWYSGKNLKRRDHWWVEKDGWIKADVDALLSEARMSELMAEVDKDRRQWIKKIDRTWFKELQPRSREQLLKILWDYNCMDPHQVTMQVGKSMISASGIIYGMEVPKRLWNLDRLTLELVAKWELLKGLHWVDVRYDKPLSYVQTPYLRDLIELLRKDSWFLTEVVSAGRHAPLFWDIWEHYSAHEGASAYLNDNALVLKKAMTTMYGVWGIGIPRDCWYYDKEVEMTILHYMPSLGTAQTSMITLT